MILILCPFDFFRARDNKNGHFHNKTVTQKKQMVTIGNLDPYTVYVVYVLVMVKDTESPARRTLTVTTSEGSK